MEPNSFAVLYFFYGSHSNQNENNDDNKWKMDLSNLYQPEINQNRLSQANVQSFRLFIN